MKTPKIFISYKRSDGQYVVRQIAQPLRRRYGKHSVFIDEDAVRIGEDFAARIDQEVRESDVVLALIGPTWLNSIHQSEANWVREELMAAHRHGKHVIPILLRDVDMPTAGSLPAELSWFAHRNAFALGAPAQLRTDIKALCRRIELHIDLPPIWVQAYNRYRASRRAVTATAIAASLALLIAIVSVLPSGAEPLDLAAATQSSTVVSTDVVRSTTDASPATSTNPTSTQDLTSTSTSLATTTSTATTTTSSTTSTTTTSSTTTSTSTTTTSVPVVSSSIAAVLRGPREICQHLDTAVLACASTRLRGSTLELPDVTNISLGVTHSCAVSGAGTLWCWRNQDESGDFQTGWPLPSSYSPVQIPLPAKAVTVAVSNVEFRPTHTCVVLSDGTVRCWGNNNFGQLGIDPDLTDINAASVTGVTDAALIAIGSKSSCAVSQTGLATCWGELEGGFQQREIEIPTPALEIAICCGNQERYIARDIRGALWTWTAGGLTVESITSDVPIIDLATSGTRVCAVDTEGEVLCTHVDEGDLWALKQMPTAFWDPAVSISSGGSDDDNFYVETSRGEHWSLFDGSEPIDEWDLP